MTERALRRLNHQFEHFGRNPHGQLNFRWCNAKELYYLYETGQMEEVQTQGGIYYARAVYERHLFADRYGPVWLLAKWEPPACDAEEWSRRFGTAFPWPRQGQYLPIESAVLPEGVEPNEQLTEYTAWKLTRHLGMKYDDHLEDIHRQRRMQERGEKSQWSDQVDDALPTFGQLPGQKMNVSFPTVGARASVTAPASA
jgi:hypothetical protein